MDHSLKFFQFHQLRPFQQHCTTVPFDCNENYCELLGVDDVAVAEVVVVVKDVGAVVVAVDIVAAVAVHQRQCNDCYDTQHSNYCYCAVAVVDTEYFVRSVEHNYRIDRSIWAGYSDVVVVQQQRYLRDCEHFAKRYYECYLYFVAHNFVTDSCLGYYDDYYVLGMMVVVVVGIFVDSLVVYADDYFVMRTIVNYLVRAPELIVVDWMVMVIVNDCVVKIVVVAELVTASMVDIVTMIQLLAFQRSIRIHCLHMRRHQPNERERKQWQYLTRLTKSIAQIKDRLNYSIRFLILHARLHLIVPVFCNRKECKCVRE